MNRSHYSHYTNSPSGDRIRKITEKLNTIHIPTDRDRGFTVDQMEQRMRVLEEKYKEFQNLQQKRYNQLKEYVNRLERNVEEERIQNETVLEEKIKLKEELDSKVVAYIDLASRQRKEHEVNFTREVNNKCNTLYEEIKRENRQRTNELDDLNMGIENEIPRLRDLINEEDEERENGDNRLLTRQNDELAKVLTEGQNERRTREENEQALFEILKDFVEKVRKEIDIERKDRENNEETLLGQLEDACSKLNNMNVE